MTKTAPPRSFTGHLAFFLVFAALFVGGGIVLAFYAAPVFAFTPLQWALALFLLLMTGTAASWELRRLLLARRSARDARRETTV